MIFVLILIILLLIAMIVYLILQISKNKDNHFKKVTQLQNVIFDLLQEQKSQASNLKLSDELKNKLTQARIALDENIMDLQFDMISIIAKKN